MSRDGAATDSLGALDDRRWRWPTRELAAAFLRYAVLIQLLWTVVYGSCSWLTAQRELRVPLATSWDSLIPFVPWTAAVYLSLGPMLWLSLFILQSPTQLRSFAKALAWLIIVSGIGFVLLPADAPIVPARAEANAFVRFADWINLEHNLCPSLHVGMAVVCATAYSRSSKSAAALFGLWAAAIALSTLLIRDHYLIDVLVGAVLGRFITARVLADRR